MNRELTEANDFLAAISMKLAKYLSPQIYKSIFSGQKDVAITTERKKLTIFFSDIKDFTATTERLQPEDLTALLNEYLTEMSTIALEHGATIDKFIGDAILVFFGDPGDARRGGGCTRLRAHGGRDAAAAGAAESGLARARHRAAVPGADRHQYRLLQRRQFRQRRPDGLHDHRRRGEPRRPPADHRRARRHLLSYETYALVRDLVRARPLPPIQMKGISREVVPYAVEGLLGELAQRSQVISEHVKGLDLFLDLDAIKQSEIDQARRRLSEALAALEMSHPTAKES